MRFSSQNEAKHSLRGENSNISNKIMILRRTVTGGSKTVPFAESMSMCACIVKRAFSKAPFHTTRGTVSPVPKLKVSISQLQSNVCAPTDLCRRYEEICYRQVRAGPTMEHHFRKFWFILLQRPVNNLDTTGYTSAHTCIKGRLQ